MHNLLTLTLKIPYQARYSYIQMIIEQEILPYFEIVEVSDKTENACKDPDDDKFIDCSISASVEFIVTGDRDFLDIGRF